MSKDTTTKGCNCLGTAWNEAIHPLYFGGIPQPHAKIHVTDTPEGLETAVYIIRACNSHDDLLAACEEIADHFDGTDSPLGILASVAVAKAKGKEPKNDE